MSEKPAPPNYLSLFISNLITLAVAFTVMYASLDKNQVEFDKTAFKTVVDRMQQQETLLGELQVEVARLQLENAELRTQLTYRVDPTKMIDIDDLAMPATIKRLNKDGTFTVVMLNNAFVYEFCLSFTYYVGKSDYQVWPEAKSKVYELHDNQVSATHTYMTTVETYPVRDCTSDTVTMREYLVQIFTVHLPDKSVGVARIFTQFPLQL